MDYKAQRTNLYKDRHQAEKTIDETFFYRHIWELFLLDKNLKNQITNGTWMIEEYGGGI